MTPLDRNALASLPLDRLIVEGIYGEFRASKWGANNPHASLVRRLCESHERLRMELEGATALLYPKPFVVTPSPGTPAVGNSDTPPIAPGSPMAADLPPRHELGGES